MFSFFKKKKTVAHIKLNGVIGNAGKFIYLTIKKVNKAEKPKSITKAYW